MPRVQRKQSCPCGSNLRFNECCQTQQTNTSGPLRFTTIEYLADGRAIVLGFIIFKNHQNKFRCILSRLARMGSWETSPSQLTWLEDPPPQVNVEEFLKDIVKNWQVVWLRGVASSAYEGFKIEAGQIACSEEQSAQSFAINRRTITAA